jgi:hypothetical protein
MDESRQMELFEFLRTSLSIDIEMDTEYECGREYATSSATIRLRNPQTGDFEEIGHGYDSVCINRD